MELLAYMELNYFKELFIKRYFKFAKGTCNFKL